MINCIIVDDEPQARKLISSYLSNFSEYTIQQSCSNAVEAYEALNTQSIDVMFLDIKMPQINGIEFIKSLNKPPLVIITSAYSKYALEGYDHNVVDFLLKPIMYPRFLQALEKIRSKLTLSQTSVPVTNSNYCFLKNGDSLLKVFFSDIEYIQGLENYVKIYFKDNKTIIVNTTMKKTEEILPRDLFIRIHRSYIVSVAAIYSVKGNTISIAGIEIPIGLMYKKSFMDIIEKFKLG